eukprot:6108774-Alexandrium_andersonii.AAC.1
MSEHTLELSGRRSACAQLRARLMPGNCCNTRCHASPDTQIPRKSVNTYGTMSACSQVGSPSSTTNLRFAAGNWRRHALPERAH